MKLSIPDIAPSPQVMVCCRTPPAFETSRLRNLNNHAAAADCGACCLITPRQSGPRCARRGPPCIDSRVICAYLMIAQGKLYLDRQPPRTRDALSDGDGILDSALAMVYEGRMRPRQQMPEMGRMPLGNRESTAPAAALNTALDQPAFRSADWARIAVVPLEYLIPHDARNWPRAMTPWPPGRARLCIRVHQQQPALRPIKAQNSPSPLKNATATFCGTKVSDVRVRSPLVTKKLGVRSSAAP